MLRRQNGDRCDLKQCCDDISTTNILAKMQLKPTDKILTDLSNICNSTSKESALTILKCWKIWIQNNTVEDWSQNETCYSAVRPLLTKKFHSLHKDNDIAKTKLSLMWLILQKTEMLMHLEGPQHVLEVFMQSCMSWLSSSEIMDSNIQSLILKLLNSLFAKEFKSHEIDNFPPLKSSILQSEKLFCRLTPILMDIFLNWPKIKYKNYFIHLWKNFLDQCERSFKFIPLPVWHKILKLVENICASQIESVQNKILILHKCATSLKSIMFNPKFVDSGLFSLTPADTLLKILVGLSMMDEDLDLSFELFKCCQEISQALCFHIIGAAEYESFTTLLLKLEDVNSKSLLWSLWCGLARCLKQKVGEKNVEQFSKYELKMFKKLRGVAVNFDLDVRCLDEKSASLVQQELGFFRIYTTFMISPMCRMEIEGNVEPCRIVQEEPMDLSEDVDAVKTESAYKGHFGYDIHSKNNGPKKPQNLVINNVMGKFVSGECIWNHLQYLAVENVNLGLAKDVTRYGLTMVFRDKSWKSCQFAPQYLTFTLQEMHNNALRTQDMFHLIFRQNLKDLQQRLRENDIFPPVQFIVSLRGKSGVDFYNDIVGFWYIANGLFSDVDFQKSINLIRKEETKIVAICLFLLLVNFMRNVKFGNVNGCICECEKVGLDQEMLVSMRLCDFARRFISYKNITPSSALLDNLIDVLPKHSDNPIALWIAYLSRRLGSQPRKESCDTQCHYKDGSIATLPWGTELRSNMDNIFTCFEKLRSRKSETNPHKTDNTRKKKSADNVIIGKSVDCTPKPKTLRSGKVCNTDDTPRILERLLSNRKKRGKGAGRDVSDIENKDVTPQRRKRQSVNAMKEHCGITGKAKHEKKSGTEKQQRGQKDGKVFQSTEDSLWRTGTSKENVPLTPSDCISKMVYLLRKRPLHPPNKFKNKEILYGDDFGRRRSFTRTDENHVSRDEGHEHDKTHFSVHESVRNMNETSSKVSGGEISVPEEKTVEAITGGEIVAFHKSETAENTCDERAVVDGEDLVEKSSEKIINPVKVEINFVMKNESFDKKVFTDAEYERECVGVKNEMETKREPMEMEESDDGIIYEEGTVKKKEETVVSAPEIPQTCHINNDESCTPQDETVFREAHADQYSRDDSVNVCPLPGNETVAEDTVVCVPSEDIIEGDTRDLTPTEYNTWLVVDGGTVVTEVAETVTVKPGAEEKDADSEELLTVENSRKEEGSVSEESGDVANVSVSPPLPERRDKFATPTSRGIKRSIKCDDGGINLKRAKLDDADGCDGVEELLLKRDEPAVKVVVERKEEFPIIESRGSRMLALIPDSPKLTRVNSSSPQLAKPRSPTPNTPYLRANSRASRMLALLPKKVEEEGVDVMAEEEAEPDLTEALKKNLRGCLSGKMHHVMLNKIGSQLVLNSPKSSPGKRRLVRFDDDRNERVMYSIQSPPCLTVIEGVCSRGIYK